MGNEGFIILNRSLLENPIFNCEPYSKGQAWVTLLMLANHKVGYITVKNGTLIKIERGECGYSELALSEIFKWSRSKVKRFLNLLESEKMIQQKTRSNRNVISILNYERYQKRTLNESVNDTVNESVNEHLTSQQTNINNNDNNDKNNIYAHFEKFYEAYPKKKSRQAAERAFNSAIKKVDFETIMKGLNAYKEEIKRKQTEEQYIKYPATWLNQGCWDDTYQQEPKYEERPYRAIGNDYKWGGETFDYENEPYRGNR